MLIIKVIIPNFEVEYLVEVFALTLLLDCDTLFAEKDDLFKMTLELPSLPF